MSEGEARRLQALEVKVESLLAKVDDLRRQLTAAEQDLRRLWGSG